MVDLEIHRIRFPRPGSSTPARPTTTIHAEEFSITPLDTPDSCTISGYFQLVSVRTNLGMTYGTDTTPAGRPRIY
jgi:hypothetical protein